MKIGAVIALLLSLVFLSQVAFSQKLPNPSPKASVSATVGLTKVTVEPAKVISGGIPTR
jgi:hypothetical protein